MPYYKVAIYVSGIVSTFACILQRKISPSRVNRQATKQKKARPYHLLEAIQYTFELSVTSK